MNGRRAIHADTKFETQNNYMGGKYRGNHDGATFATRHPGNDRQICEAANKIQAGCVWLSDYNITPPEVPLADSNNRVWGARTDYRRSSAILR